MGIQTTNIEKEKEKEKKKEINTKYQKETLHCTENLKIIEDP